MKAFTGIKSLFAFAALLLATMAMPAFGQVKQHMLQGKRNKYADSLVVHADTSVPVLINKIENYSYVIDHTNFLFRNPLNISPIYLDLNQIEKRLDGFKSRLEQHGKQMNLRSINSGIILLREVADKLAGYKRLLTDYSTQLHDSNLKVKKIISDPTLKIHLGDSVLADQLTDLLTEGKRLDSIQGETLGRVNLLQNHVSIDLLQARDIISDMSYLSIEKKMAMWAPEEAPLFETHNYQYQQTLPQVIEASGVRSFKIISTYIAGKWKVLSWSLLVFVFLLVWTLSNLYRIRKSDNAAASLLPVHFLTRSIVAACLFAFLTYSPFFFANPPMSYLHTVELLRLLLLIFFLLPFLTRQARIAGLVLSFLWVVFAWDDLLLDTAFGERWILFVAAILLILLCIRLIRQGGPFFVSISESPATKAVLFFALTFAVLSVVFNISGRLTLANITGVAAVQGIVVGITLKVFFTLVVEAIYLQFKSFSHRRLSGMFNFAQLYAASMRAIWTLAIIVWTISIIRNLTFYDELIKGIDSFIDERRTIGSMVFTFRSIGVFILIVWSSIAISALINFFFGSEAVTDIKKKGRVSSMMLLIRLAIWIIGFLIGVSAAGIPLDKLSIMIGAFGVGIGFGLQNIVNNLVSGVILAFERPIQVGDSIEVAGKAGVVKEIGVRSSKIENAEGAYIIIPNGDLLSQQLVNWTMQDSTRRLDFMLTLPFPSDIEKVKTLVLDTIKKNEHVLQQPAPSVNVQDIQASNIQIKIMWWIPDLNTASSVRSEVMQNIFETLNSAGVVFDK